jgi:cystathionine beta-lyase/cystathionine gamma-synthase
MSHDKDEEYLVLSKQDKGYIYNRSGSTENTALQRELLQRHNGASVCTITSSGMQAISAVLHGILLHHKFQKFNLVYANELYCDTPRLFKFLASTYNNLALHQVDITNSNAILDLFSNQLKGQPSILFFEACSNPSGLVFDMDILGKLKKTTTTLYVIVDNTWLTDVIFQPFKVGSIDFVIMSLTKYYSAGHCIGGVVLGRGKAVMKSVKDWMIINGHHTSPYNCDLVLQNMKNMQERLQKSSELTLKVVEYLTKHNKVRNVMHPLCKNHPTYNLATKYFLDGLGPSVITFCVKGQKAQVLEVLERATILEHKTSFGAKMSRTDPWPKQQGDYTEVRLSIGFEDDYDRIVKGLNEIIEKR